MVSFFSLPFFLSWSSLTRAFMRQILRALLILESFHAPFPSSLGYHFLVVSDSLGRMDCRGTAAVVVMPSPASMCHTSTNSACHSQASLSSLSLSAQHSSLCCLPGPGKWCDHASPCINVMGEVAHSGSERHGRVQQLWHRKSKPPLPHYLVIIYFCYLTVNLNQICSCPLGARSSSAMRFSITSSMDNKICWGNIALAWLNDKWTAAAKNTWGL